MKNVIFSLMIILGLYAPNMYAQSTSDCLGIAGITVTEWVPIGVSDITIFVPSEYDLSGKQCLQQDFNGDAILDLLISNGGNSEASIFYADSEGVYRSVDQNIKPLSINDILPNFGSISGGMEIAISGEGFTQSTTVKFGHSMAGQITYIDSHNLIVVAPSYSAAGKVDIELNDIAGRSYTHASSFEYIEDLSVEIVSPGYLEEIYIDQGNEYEYINVYGTYTGTGVTSLTVNGRDAILDGSNFVVSMPVATSSSILRVWVHNRFSQKVKDETYIHVYEYDPQSTGEIEVPAEIPETMELISQLDMKKIEPVVTAADVLVNIERLYINESEYALVYEIDIDKVPLLAVGENDPYWWQYYRSFWDDNGVFIGSNAESMLNSSTWSAGPYLDSLISDWYELGWSTVTEQGVPSKSGGFRDGVFFSVREYHLDKYKFGGSVVNAYFQHHFTKRIDSNQLDTYWYPGWSSLGNSYYLLDEEMSGVSQNFQIQLYNKTAYSPETHSTQGVFDWEYVIAGEVAESGWGIVPTDVKKIGDSNQELRWVFVKPKGEDLRLKSSNEHCPVIPNYLGEFSSDNLTPCIVEPDLWLDVDSTKIFNKEEGFCRDSAGFDFLPQHECRRLLAADVNGVFSTPEELANLRSIIAKAQVSFGALAGELTVYDYLMEGKFLYVSANGHWAELPLDAAKIFVNHDENILVNGSTNTFSSSLDLASRVASEKNSAIILVYMPQSLNYFAEESDRTKTRTQLSSLLQGYTGTGLSLTCHSWSVHICANEASSYSNVNMNLVNGAHLPYSDASDQYIHDVRYSAAKIRLINGDSDNVSKYGAGQYTEFAGVCVSWLVPCQLQQTVNSNSNVVQIKIEDTGHAMADMFSNGMVRQMY